MLLPNRYKAYVPPPKLRDYLLSETHPVSRSKAKFFRSFGYNEINTELLEYGLMVIAQAQPVREVIASAHGRKYVIEGNLETPASISVRIKAVWIIDTGKAEPRFVTAYPA